MKIRLVEVVLFDSVRHDEAYNHFLHLWDRAKNVYDKAYLKPLRNILHGSMDYILSKIILKCFLWFSRRGMIRLKAALTG